MRKLIDFQPLQVPSRAFTPSCEVCGLYRRQCLSPLMAPCGEGVGRIVVIGEAPGVEEDEKGKPWQGRAGRALQQTLRTLGVELFRDCVSLNAVNCRPPNNRMPSAKEVECCREVKVLPAIRQVAPRVILLLGAAAVDSLIGYRWGSSPSGISAWRGWTIPDRELQAWVCPTFHPSYILRQGAEESEAAVIQLRDLTRALQLVDKPLPPGNEDKAVVLVPTSEVSSVLTKLLREKPSLLAVDIEATGLKPYNRGEHRILSIALAPSADRVYVFPFPQRGSARRLLKWLLEHPGIGKVAHNFKYEHCWLQVLYGIEVSPWVLDTMVAAHVLDNRPGIVGLKFQAYVRFGVLYADAIAEFVRADSAGMNRMQEAMRYQPETVLRYNGMDALLTYRLATMQMEEMGWGKQR